MIMKIKVKKTKPDDSHGAIRVYSKPLISSSIIADPRDKIFKRNKSITDKILDMIRVN